MPSTTLRNAVDTYADQTKPSTTFGDNRKLGLATGAAYAYLFFSTPVPAGAAVSSAMLTLYRAGAWSGTTVVSIQRLKEKLNTSHLNWNNKPDVVAGTPLTPSIPAGADAAPFTLDVTSILQAVANGSPWYGLRLSIDKALRYVSSSQGLSGLRPILTVTWSDAPTKPTRLSPTAGQKVSAVKPVLRFQFNDALGDTTLAAARVQVDDAADFVGAFDSGWIPTTDQLVDLAALTAPAYPGLAAGATAWWRVAARDGSGLESDWSNGAEFGYQPLGVVTILNPASGAPAYVSESTPPILWSFNKTQTRWRVFISSPTDPDTPLKNGDSGQRTGTETAWTVPKKVLTTPGPYRVTVQVWDNQPRQDDEWAEAATDFVVQDDPAVTKVAGLLATQPNQWPTVRLEWTRGTAPDSFTIARDGVELEDELLPGDALVSGTTYRWSGPGGKGWRSHTFAVRAKVNGDQSQPTSVAFTPKSRGIWLLDEARGLRVWIAGDDAGNWTEPEDAAEFAPLGGKSIMRRIMAVRNYEGELSGQLVDIYGRLARDYEADLRAMRDNPQRPVNLAVADFNLDVLLGDVQIIPTPNVPPSRLVTFAWWEVD